MKTGTIFTRDLIHAVSYADMSPIQRFCHNVRLTVSTWDGVSKRFTGRDRREHNPTNDAGQHIGNRFELGTALVASDSGAIHGTVVARSADRAAAAAALKAARNGHIVSNWTVQKFNKTGAACESAHFFGADAPNGGTDDGDDGSDRSDTVTVTMTALEIATLDKLGADASDMDGWQDTNWDDRRPWNAIDAEFWRRERR